MKWTKDKPTKTGIYLVRNVSTEIVEVFFSNNNAYVQKYGGDETDVHELSSTFFDNFEWSDEPIPEPEEN